MSRPRRRPLTPREHRDHAQAHLDQVLDLWKERASSPEVQALALMALTHAVLAIAPDLVTPCPGECGRRVRPGHLVCGPCWRQIRVPLERAVWSHRRAYQKNPTAERWAAYTAARETALEAIP
ncbi:MAG: hypothetical protein H6515_14740 [Microthrixaceae bacterium]|jgi:hypothetical protein|nr:hypothetical protein [Microthrixaceae bacterium]